MATKTFDPNQVTLTFNSIGISHIATGFAKDTFINIEFDEDLFNDDIDANGNLIRYKINNYNAKLTLTLNQASITNSVLSTFMNLDRNLATGGAFAMMAKDNNGDTLITSAYSYVITLPTVTFGTTASNRDWVIRMGDAQAFIGGITR